VTTIYLCDDLCLTLCTFVSFQSFCHRVRKDHGGNSWSSLVVFWTLYFCLSNSTNVPQMANMIGMNIELCLLVCKWCPGVEVVRYGLSPTSTVSRSWRSFPCSPENNWWSQYFFVMTYVWGFVHFLVFKIFSIGSRRIIGEVTWVGFSFNVSKMFAG